jgi:ADP-ribosylglycohydrolase
LSSRLADKPEAERFNITQTVSSITHAHPWSVAACCIYLEYPRKLLGGMEKRAAYAEVRGDFSDGHLYINADTLGKFARILRSDLSALPETGIKSGGFVIDIMEAAFWCFLTTDNYRDAVLKAVNLGEDTDTTVAVTGGMAGLAYDIKAIPTVWLESLAGYGEIRCIAGTLAEALST